MNNEAPGMVIMELIGGVKLFYKHMSLLQNYLALIDNISLFDSH